MENIKTGNGLRVCFNSDTGNQLPQTNNNIEINEISSFPVLTIESDTQEFNTFNSDFKEKLLGNQDANEMTISVNYIPDDETHKYLDEKLQTQDEFQLVLIYDQDDENISYSIVNGMLSGSEITGDKDAVLQKSFSFVPTQLIARSAIAKVQDTLVRGDYGVGSNGTTVPQYQPDVPSGNAFIKVPSSYSPSGSDALGVGLVDNDQYSSLVMSKTGALQIYARNTNTAWSRIFTANESDSKYVMKTITINGKVLTGNITLTPSDIGSYSKSETDNKFVPKTTTVNGKELSTDITLSPSDIGTMASTEIKQTFVPKTTTINGKELSTDITLTPSDIGSYSKSETDTKYVPLTRTINGKALTSNIALNASDVGLGNVINQPSYSKAEIDRDLNFIKASFVPIDRSINGKTLNGNIALNATDVGAYSKAETDRDLNFIKASFVPIDRSINGKTLNGNIVLTTTDVGALPITGGTINGSIVANNVTGGNIYSSNIVNAVSEINGGNIISRQNIYLRSNERRLIMFQNLSQTITDAYIYKDFNGALVLQPNGHVYAFQDDGWAVFPNLLVTKELSSTGNLYVKNLINSSDQKIKKNIQVIENALDKLQLIKGVTYEKESNLYRGDDELPTYEEEAGFIAQDILKVLPTAVAEYRIFDSNKPLLGIKLGQIEALLCQGIKELDAKVKVLEGIISKMQSEPEPEPDSTDNNDDNDSIEKENDK